MTGNLLGILITLVHAVSSTGLNTQQHSINSVRSSLIYQTTERNKKLHGTAHFGPVSLSQPGFKLLTWPARETK